MPSIDRQSKYSVMLGFRPDDLDVPPAFLRIADGGYQLVDQMSAASLFEREDGGRSGWAPPSAWARFFAEEDELSGWRFRAVPTTRKPAQEVR